MGRAIKFRGKRIDNGEWVIGSLVIDPDLSQYSICGFNYYNGETGLEREPFQWTVDPDTVGQYTGKKDEEGTEIYDRDHLWAPGNLDDDLQPVGMVVWDDEDARWEVFSVNGRFEWIPDGCVVRNEHPHLLQEQGEKTD